MRSPAIFLSTRNLSIGYEKSRAGALFNNLDLLLERGRLVCFMGPNGIGKSTLIRTLAGLQKPLGGQIILSTREETPPSQKIAVVLTDRVTAVNMSARELIAFGRYPYLDWRLRFRASDREHIDHAIQVTGVQSFVHRKLSELSDGQIQMAMIARALAQDCDIIMLDEPTAHLDLNNRVEIMNLLRGLTRSTGKAILISTHDLGLALQTSDQVWLAGKNKQILRGIPEDLVLNGSFDEVFQFKGFDLKTGQIAHPVTPGRTVTLRGHDADYLWTKNALERNGFQIGDNGPSVVVERKGETLMWLLNAELSNSLEAMLEKLSAHYDRLAPSHNHNK